MTIFDILIRCEPEEYDVDWMRPVKAWWPELCAVRKTSPNYQKAKRIRNNFKKFLKVNPDYRII